MDATDFFAYNGNDDIAIYAAVETPEGYFVGGYFRTVDGGVQANSVAFFPWSDVESSPYPTVLGNGLDVGVRYTYQKQYVDVGGLYVPAEFVLNYIPAFVYCMLFDGRFLWVGGEFDYAGAGAASNIARYDTTTNTWYASSRSLLALLLLLLPGTDGCFVYSAGYPPVRRR